MCVCGMFSAPQPPQLLCPPPSVELLFRPIHLLLPLLYWDRKSSSSWLWMLTRSAPLAVQSSLAAPQLFFWDQSTLWKSWNPKGAGNSALGGGGGAQVPGLVDPSTW